MYSAIRPVVVTVKKRYRLSNFALIQKYGIVYFRINNAKTKKKMTCSRWKKMQNVLYFMNRSNEYKKKMLLLGKHYTCDCNCVGILIEIWIIQHEIKSTCLIAQKKKREKICMKHHARDSFPFDPYLGYNWLQWFIFFFRHLAGQT